LKKLLPPQHAPWSLLLLGLTETPSSNVLGKTGHQSFSIPTFRVAEVLGAMAAIFTVYTSLRRNNKLNFTL
jgi:hypothetical protein